MLSMSILFIYFKGIKAIYGNIKINFHFSFSFLFFFFGKLCFHFSKVDICFEISLKGKKKEKKEKKSKTCEIGSVGVIEFKKTKFSKFKLFFKVKTILIHI